METNSSEKRIDFLKQDGSDLFTEGDITGATEMFIAAMRLEMDQRIQELIIPKQTLQGSECNYISDEDNSQRSNKCSGMNSVIAAVMHNAEEAIKLNPSLSKSYKSKATALILQTKWDEARDAYLAGINACDDCTELRQALKNLQETQRFLQSIPEVLERTTSMSSDTSESTLDGRSPTAKSKRFRLQHRKKLSRPMVGLLITTSLQSQEEEDDDDDMTTTNTP